VLVHQTTAVAARMADVMFMVIDEAYAADLVFSVTAEVIVASPRHFEGT
jgi:hypothetical protein